MFQPMIRRVALCNASDDGKLSVAITPISAHEKSLGRARIKRISLGRLACNDVFSICLCYSKPVKFFLIAGAAANAAILVGQLLTHRPA